ncbi:PfkB family carbohydrate kinase [Gordonia sp. DT219]|uniref:PfkB family carbohydrate kinase n=1 Tax=Gordonia sp. DT219 TaxID=3416658 RepID=UPI003CEE74B0
MSAPRVVVIGDTLLDRDIVGTSTRTSPEAPTAPVVDADECRESPGGAGLTAILAARRGAEVTLVTALADDAAGWRLDAALAEYVDVVALPLDGETVCKTRIIADGALVTRVDTGHGVARADVPIDKACDAIGSAETVLVSDYGRGVTAIGWLRDRVAEAALRGTPVVWDPHPRGHDPVWGTTLITPNADEAARLGFDWRSAPADTPRCWSGASSIVVTCGADGAVLIAGEATSASAPPVIPAELATMPLDTCGAGDAFAAAAALALAGGRSVAQAVADAVGVASALVHGGGVKQWAHRAVDDESVLDLLLRPAREATSRRDGTLVATGGCFDLLHVGHISLLRRARELGDRLVVCLNSDESIRRNKGPGRPLVPAQDRARVLHALECVDDVIIFDDDTPERVLASLRPDVWVKGDDYDPDAMPETPVVRAHGGRVVVLGRVPGHSTTRLARAAAAS